MNNFYKGGRGLAHSQREERASSRKEKPPRLSNILTGPVRGKSSGFPSVTVRQVIGFSSRHPRDLFARCSGGLREVFGSCSENPEQHPKNTHRDTEGVPNQSRSGVEAHPKETRTASEEEHIVLDTLQTGLLDNLRLPFLGFLRVSLKSLFFKATKNKVVLPYGLLCFMLFNLSDAWAQSAETRAAERQTEIKPLQVGDTIPETIWNMPLQVVKHAVDPKTIKLADYRGKVIILDYWATWCISCINAMPGMHELAQAYPDDVVLLPVTHESVNLITGYLQKTRSEQIRALLPSFETIVAGQPLKDLIPHETIPHIAVINGDGILEQTTMPHLLNKEVVGKIVRREAYDIPVYRGALDTTILSPTYDDVKSIKPNYYSMVSGYLNGFQNGYKEWTDSTNMIKRGQYINKPLLTLFLAALKPRFNILMPNRRIMLMEDPKALDYFHERNPDYLRSESNLCYEYALPDTWTAAKIRRRMLLDLQDLTGFNAKIVEIDVPCIILKSGNKLIAQKRKTQLSGIIMDEVLVSARVPEHVGPSESGAKNYLSATGIEGFVYYMNTAKEGAIPFMINETGSDYPVDLDLPDDLYDIDVLETTLSEQGIEVVTEIRKMAMFVMADTPIEKLPSTSNLELGKFGYVIREESNND